MSVSPYIDEEERASQVLRASVADAAMTLGPGVTGWMFQNAVAEEDEDEEQQVSTPGLVSSSSSEDSHSTALSSPVGHDNTFSRPMISYPTKLTPLSSFEQGYYLKSPFVVVDQDHFPRFPDVPGYPYVPPIDTSDIPRPIGLSSASTLSSPNPLSPETKKPSRGFKFSPKKPSSRGLSSQSSEHESLSRRTSPVTSPSDTISRSVTPTSRATSPGLSATPRNPGKLKKTRPVASKDRDGSELPTGAQGWDFKDPDRPSFFAIDHRGAPDPPRASSPLGHSDIPKGKNKAKKAVGIDDGYMSEGTGKAKARAKKDKETRPPLKRSMTSRLMSKLSSSDLQASTQREPTPPPLPPMPHPIHDRFASARSITPEREQLGAAPTQEVKNQLSAEWRKVAPAERDRTPYLKVSNAGSRLNVPIAEPSPASSTSSFTIVPDMNAANRRMQQWGHTDGHAVGSDNERKLAMLAKLITDAPIAPAIEVHSPTEDATSPPEITEPEQVIEVPSSSFIVPSPTVERPSSAVMRYYEVPLSPKPPASSRPPPSAASRSRLLAPTSAQLRVQPGLTTSPEAARSGSAPPTMMHHQIQVRGRQAPFPTKPILPTQGTGLTRSASQSHFTRNPVLAKNPQFLRPKRYENTQALPVPSAYDPPDVPRSVRSSYSRDLEREEQVDDRDDRSVYSESSRASFMDVGKSIEARGNLVRGIDALSRGQEPRWF